MTHTTAATRLSPRSIQSPRPKSIGRIVITKPTRLNWSGPVWDIDPTASSKSSHLFTLAQGGSGDRDRSIDRAPPPCGSGGGNESHPTQPHLIPTPRTGSDGGKKNRPATTTAAAAAAAASAWAAAAGGGSTGDGGPAGSSAAAGGAASDGGGGIPWPLCCGSTSSTTRAEGFVYRRQ